MKYDITKHNPCEEAVEWYEQFDTFEHAWQVCHRGDWMLWIAQELGVDIKTLTKAKALCANTVRHLMKYEISRKAIDVALAFADGKATKEELDNAAYAAAIATYTVSFSATYAASFSGYVAASCAAADAATYAAYTDSFYTADAAYSAYAATFYAAAADGVATSFDAAFYAAATDTRQENMMETADICREVLTKAVFEKIDKPEDTKKNIK